MTEKDRPSLEWDRRVLRDALGRVIQKCDGNLMDVARETEKNYHTLLKQIERLGLKEFVEKCRERTKE